MNVTVYLDPEKPIETAFDVAQYIKSPHNPCYDLCQTRTHGLSLVMGELMSPGALHYLADKGALSQITPVMAQGNTFARRFMAEHMHFFIDYYTSYFEPTDEDENEEMYGDEGPSDDAFGEILGKLVSEMSDKELAELQKACRNVFKPSK